MTTLPVKPADGLNAEDTQSAARQTRPSGPRHAAVEQDEPSSPLPNDGVKATPTTSADPAPDEVAADGGPDQALVRLAPHPLRLLAFAVDLLLVAIVTVPITLAASSSMLFALATLTLVFVVYHTASVWLTGGKTIGKALCNLSVCHLDGSAPAHDAAGLVWAFGRASVGYLVVDLFGLGVLVALRSPQRRCLHDYGFRSQVVSHLSEADPLQPRGRLADAAKRLREFSDERETAVETAGKDYWLVVRLWKWLVKLSAGCLAWMLVVQGKWRWLVAKVSGHAAVSTPAKALSAGKTAALVSGTALATGAVTVVAGAVYLSTSIVGDWGNPAGMRIERVGLDTYQAVRLSDYIGSNNGCLFPKGEIVERFQGRGSHFTGSELWSNGSNGQNCTLAWGPGTVDLVGNETLKICSTNPEGDHRHECGTWVRTPKH